MTDDTDRKPLKRVRLRNPNAGRGRPAIGSLDESAHPTLTPGPRGASTYTDAKGVQRVATPPRTDKGQEVVSDPDALNPQQRGKFTPPGGFTEGQSHQRIASTVRAGTGAVSPRNHEGDAADAEIGEAAINRERIDMERAFPRPGFSSPRGTQPVPAPEGDGTDGDIPPNSPQHPAARLAFMETHHPDYAREYKMQLVHRLLMRGLPLDTIATMIGVSTRSVQNIRSELMERLRKEAKRADVYTLAGQTMSFYNEVRAMAMRIASDNKPATTEATKLHALRTALSAEADKHRFLQASGFYDSARFIPNEDSSNDNGDTSNLGKEVMGILSTIIGSADGEISDAEIDTLFEEEEDDHGVTRLF